ncbi:hypothetical protein FHR24_003082 [Wenyingzhuangia heitensis]|uniref:Uncharacterized protein n=1 Tax=Wenyingzhuangia heitensis TaxID=1487859 RepID=A0ABX0UHV2_9FLAO|nr:hypothetical protein [Wenyingzhuangia heitensis]NIJ46592.1 hypothetical protein [Wenyingzhuangia heitensis]
MTPKQVERIQNKIKKIKRELAADKKHWGGFYHDGRGLRYLPPELYLKLNDYSGAMRYFNWFDKNFPEDSGFPIFLFEWTITLFKKNKIKLAEKKALETFYSNTYLIDIFLGNELLHFDKDESSNWEYSSLVENLKYSENQVELNDFSKWLKDFTTTETFYNFANKFIKIEIELKNEPVGKKRSSLVNEKYQLLENLK